MNELSHLAKSIKSFCESHSMVESFAYVDDPSKIAELGEAFRRVVIFPLTFEITNDTYMVTFGLVVQDKVRGLDFTAHIKSQEANMYIVGELEEYLYQIDNDITITDTEFIPNEQNDAGENLTACVASINAQFHRYRYTDLATS
jgi:hypothetical protein